MSAEETAASAVTLDHNYANPAARQLPTAQQIPDNNVSTRSLLAMSISFTDCFITSQRGSSTVTSNTVEKPTPRKKRKQNLQPTFDYDLDVSSVSTAFTRTALAGGKMSFGHTTTNPVSFPGVIVQTKDIYAIHNKCYFKLTAH